MSTQISLKLPDKLLQEARTYVEEHGYTTLQELIREVLREKLFEDEKRTTNGSYTSLASESALAKHWLAEKEEKAWKHLQKDK
ncbi:MAG: ribbon-helix-helix domain-containing protein [Nanobdellota archaeon]